ncbi:hypothetical protein [Pseudomonas sp. RL]|uniref:hypothetical protein n=1 Tax=Pseudomonas sp. RL TaxID=1452718 RepID=UPI0012DC98DB|nr:hypothetical protein [Pseudomonas sp. RL]
MEADHGESFKELCAHYGAAMYFAQVLEHGIANALLFLDLIPRTSAKYSPEQFDAFYEDQFEKTLGNLIRTLKSVTTVPKDLEDALQESKDRRAHVAHHFFREAADDIYLKNYQKRIDELEGHRAFFQATDELLEAFVWPVMQSYGYTEATMERAMKEYGKYLEHDP